MATAEMPTEMGSPIYAGHHPKFDAECVARLTHAGGYVLGKTVTTEFAYIASRQDEESVAGAAHAGRIVVRLGGRGGRGAGSRCARHADQRLGDPARGILRHRRVQATRADTLRGRACLQRDAGPGRHVRARCRGRSAPRKRDRRCGRHRRCTATAAAAASRCFPPRLSVDPYPPRRRRRARGGGDAFAQERCRSCCGGVPAPWREGCQSGAPQDHDARGRVRSWRSCSSASVAHVGQAQRGARRRHGGDRARINCIGAASPRRGDRGLCIVAVRLRRGDLAARDGHGAGGSRHDR